MAARFISYQAAHQTQMLLASSALPAFSRHVCGLLIEPSFALAPYEFPSAGRSGVSLRNKLTSLRDLGSLGKCWCREGGCQRAVVELGPPNPALSGRGVFKHHRNSCGTATLESTDGSEVTLSDPEALPQRVGLALCVCISPPTL